MHLTLALASPDNAVRDCEEAAGSPSAAVLDRRKRFMAGPTEKNVLDALRAVRDPDLNKDIVEAGFIKDLKIEGGRISFEIELTTPACPLKAQFEEQARAAVSKLPGVSEVEVRMTSRVRGAAPEAKENPVPGVKNVVAVASGKGGVGKSTVAANLAVGLAQAGATVGLLDGDIYGPSMPTMMGASTTPDVRKVGGREKMLPVAAHGVSFLSMGLLVDPSAPIVWRGPMLHKALQQFLGDVEWGELDYLIVDLPPGTGDIQISLVQSVPLTGAVIVSTPQEVALGAVRRAVGMFRTCGVEILGVVENMACFVCPGCSRREEIFGSGGSRAEAERFGVPFLGEIPLVTRIRESGDAGAPLLARERKGPDVEAFREVVGNLAAAVSKRNEKAPPPRVFGTK